MNREELTEELRKQYVKEIPGEKKNRTLEEALQEALDNTTPKFPGTPNAKVDESGEFDDAEWI